MADDAQLRQRRARGQAAQRILDDVLVKEAFEMIERRIYAAWKESAPEDDRARHDCYLMHNLFVDFAAFFKDAIHHGSQSQKELIRREGSAPQGPSIA